MIALWKIIEVRSESLIFVASKALRPERSEITAGGMIPPSAVIKYGITIHLGICSANAAMGSAELTNSGFVAFIRTPKNMMTNSGVADANVVVQKIDLFED